jgi:hypothetical protein
MPADIAAALGTKANIKKAMLNSQAIGCHTLPQADLW